MGISTYNLLMYYAKLKSKNGVPDPTAILEKECFEMWLNTRRVLPSNLEEGYRRAITAHITGTKKRKPFPPEFERALLKAIRIRKVWPCFQNRISSSGKPVVVGVCGFRPDGYHERRRGFFIKSSAHVDDKQHSPRPTKIRRCEEESKEDEPETNFERFLYPAEAQDLVMEEPSNAFGNEISPSRNVDAEMDQWFIQTAIFDPEFVCS